MTGLEPPTVTLPLGEREVRVDTGELFFPLIALAFCLVYYVDTRGLPEESMMYAGPLLYVTAALAVITMLTHGVAIDRRGGPERGTSASERIDDAPSASDGPADGDSTDRAGDRATAADGATDSPGALVGEPDGVDSPDVSSAAEATRRAADSTVDEDVDREVGGHFNLRTASGLAALSAGYVASLYVTSFVVASILFLAASLYVLGERRPLRVLAYSVGFTLLVWGVFIQWLLVPLP